MNDELEFDVISPGMWENETGPLNWWAVATEHSGGIIAYFRDEASAYEFVELLKIGQVKP